MIIKKFNYKLVDSTNNTAINLIKKKNIQSGIVIAENQKNGKGQYGRKWISYKGNLFVSIFFSLEKINMSLKQLTKINTNFVIKLISKYYKKKITLKLPNDILINKKKISGILQEVIEKNEKKYLIVGIGLNVIKNPNIEGYPTINLCDLTNSKIDLNKITIELKKIYENFLNKKINIK